MAPEEVHANSEEQQQQQFLAVVCLLYLSVRKEGQERRAHSQNGEKRSATIKDDFLSATGTGKGEGLAWI